MSRMKNSEPVLSEPYFSTFRRLLLRQRHSLTTATISIWHLRTVAVPSEDRQNQDIRVVSCECVLFQFGPHPVSVSSYV